MTRIVRAFVFSLIATLVVPQQARAQDTAAAQPPVHEHVEVKGALLTPTRDASGTAWVPAATPMYGVHQPWRGWDLRLVGSVFGQLTHEPTERHRTGGPDSVQVSSVNWGMAMLRRTLGGGRFGVRGMISADAWTTSSCGSINLLATGEVCERDTVHDRQQPHDFVMELAADYELPIHADWRWQIYGGIAGEPALGPPGYAHRASAAANPSAPVSHHLIDPPTAFGVVTTGVNNGRWKIEASAFNGRSADESRVDIDFGALDSTSVRVSVLPTDRLALQLSGGRTHQAASEVFGLAGNAAARFVASAAYHRPLGDAGVWATTVAYGVSKGRELIAGTPFEIVSDGLIVESTVAPNDRHSWFGRIEIVAIPAHHLHAHEFVDAVFTTAKVHAGYMRHFRTRAGLVPGAGASVAVAFVPDLLAPRYYGNLSPSLTFFLNVRPARHGM
jgi:hypothetical protein